MVVVLVIKFSNKDRFKLFKIEVLIGRFSSQKIKASKNVFAIELFSAFHAA